MVKFSFVLWCSVNVKLLTFLTIHSAVAQDSPCPGVFDYQYYGDEIVGLITIANPPSSRNKLDISLSIKSRIVSNYVGRVEVVDRDNLQNIVRGGNFQYRVHFPFSRPLPKVTSIIFNGNLLCSGPPEKISARGDIVTKIELEHMLRFEETPGPSNIAGQSWNIDSNDGFNQNQNVQNLPSANIPNYNTNAGNSNFYPNRYNSSQNTYSKPNNYNNQDPYFNRGSTNTFNKNQYPYTEEATQNSYEMPIITRPPVSSTTRPTTRRTSFTTTRNKRPARRFECGITHQDTNTLVVGGFETAPGDWPWIVAIFTRSIGALNYICTGSLLSESIVVTAAHCTYMKNRREKLNPEDVLLKTGVHNIHEWDENNPIRKVSKVEYPFNFNHSAPTAVDIAVLVIKTRLEFSATTIPICLWNGNTDIENVKGKRGVVVGWGRDESNLQTTPEPRMTQAPIVTNDECRNSQDALAYHLNDKKFCAGNRDGKGPCNGDSGAGLYLWRTRHWELRGIVSFSLKNQETFTCDLANYVVYTDAAKHIQWLEDLIKQF